MLKKGLYAAQIQRPARAWPDPPALWNGPGGLHGLAGPATYYILRDLDARPEWRARLPPELAHASRN